MQVITLTRRQSFAQKARNAAAFVGGLGLSALVMAQSATDPFDAALTEATTKVSSYAAALVGLAAVAVIFMIAIKYVKKIPRAS